MQTSLVLTPVFSMVYLNVFVSEVRNVKSPLSP